MKDYKKNDGCKTAFVIFGMPDKNKTNLAKTPQFPCFLSNSRLKYV